MNELVFVGTGEALDPALPNTSLLYCGPRTLLLDCGYAVPHAFWRISQDVDLLDGVWISHGHADHCFGLPALLLWMRLGGRTRGLTVFGGPGSRGRLEQVLELGYPGSFAASKCYPISFVEIEPGGVVEFGALELRVAASAHSIVNYALRVDTPGVRSVMYSGDGAITQGTRGLARGVDVLVHECFFVSGEGQRKHGDVEGCMALAREAGVQTLGLLHFAAEAKGEIARRVGELDDGGFEVLLPLVGDLVCLVV